jgi:hypothetical protein
MSRFDQLFSKCAWTLGLLMPLWALGGDRGSYPMTSKDNPVQAEAETLLAELSGRLQDLKDLRATLNIQADVPKVKIRPLSAEMYFLAPNRFQLRSSRLALLPRQNPMELFEFLKSQSAYRVLGMGYEAVRKERCLQMNVMPTATQSDWQLIRLWVHAQTGRIYKAEVTRRSLGTVLMDYFYHRAPSHPGLRVDLPDSLLFETDATMMKLPKALTADLHRGRAKEGQGSARPLQSPDGKARVAMGFRWIAVNQGAAAQFFLARKGS